MSERFLTTREAAAFMRVSAASVRRWTDAGILATQRVGRRGERRFTEDDLRRFMTAGRQEAASAAPTSASAVSVRGVNLPIPSHIATYFASDEGRLRLSIPFLIAGLRAANPCFLVTSDGGFAAYSKALTAQGVEVDAALESGQLTVASGIGGSLGQALSFWEGAWGHALEKGPAVIRVVGDMALELQGLGSLDDLMAYEQSYDLLARRYPVATICQYDVRAFDGVSLLRSLKAHPDLSGLGLSSFLV
jgi:transcriptional repressor of dcmA and dcmR